MKPLARTTLGLLLASAGIATSAEDASLPPESRRLRAAYSRVAQAPGDRAASQGYLEAFPSDPGTFAEVFAGSSEAHLRDAQACIALLGDIGRQYPEATFDKLLRLESGVRFESGAPDPALDPLQRVTLKLALAQPKAFAGALSGLRPRERAAVTAFLTDGPEGPPEETLGLAAKLEIAGFGDLAEKIRNEATLSEALRNRS